jgi:hypothetical protein
MSRKIIPLRPPSTPPAKDGAAQPRAIPRVLSHPPGMTREAIVEAAREHERLIDRYEPRLTAIVAKVLHDRLPPIETWVAAILTSPVEGDEEDLVEVAPREQAIDVAKPWHSIHAALLEAPLPDRLDIIVEARLAISLFSFDVEPALPVTRRVAEAVNLPAHLLFAKGEAFASVGEEAVAVESLQVAWEEHCKLLDEQSDELLEGMRERSGQMPLGQCAGVVLSLGPDGRATSVVTREQALKVVAHEPFLARKVTRATPPWKLPDGRDAVSIPIVVWAKGHVSVHARDVVAVA